MSNTKTLKRFLTVVMVVLLLMSACAPAALASVKAEINAATKVYKTPSTSGSYLYVPKGLTVSVTKVDGSWAKISYKGNSAWIPGSYLNLAVRLPAYTKKSTTVYKQASASSSKLGTVSANTKVYVVGKSGGYYRVQNASGSVTGYVKDDYLSSTPVSSSSSSSSGSILDGSIAGSTVGGSVGSIVGSSSSFANKLWAIIQPLLGKPYAASAHAPDSFNCSTFVKYVLDTKLGYSMKSTAAAQASDSNYTKIYSLSSLKAGDVVCFDMDGDGSCDHTGIYLWDGIFAEASQNYGAVRTATFNDYYKSTFKWALRTVG